MERKYFFWLLTPFLIFIAVLLLAERRVYNETYNLGLHQGKNDSSNGLVYDSQYKINPFSRSIIFDVQKKGQIEGYRKGYDSGYDKKESKRILESKSLKQRIAEGSAYSSFRGLIERNDTLEKVRAVLGEPSKEEKGWTGHFVYKKWYYYRGEDKRICVTFTGNLVDTCREENKVKALFPKNGFEWE